jgi:hypothetical protein
MSDTTDHSHGFGIGDFVRFNYGGAAISAQMNGHRYEGQGIIRKIWLFQNEPPIGIETRPGGPLTCVFPREITHTLALGPR